MQNLAYHFAFKANSLMGSGFNYRTSLTLAAEDFRKNHQLTAIALRKRIDNEKSHRRYYFIDGTHCIFCNGEFKLHNRNKAY